MFSISLAISVSLENCRCKNHEMLPKPKKSTIRPREDEDSSNNVLPRILFKTMITKKKAARIKQHFVKIPV
jgi:hypothetical protein